jgi:hypothetical protein
LVDELSRESAEFAVMWHDNEVRTYGEGTKHVRHPKAGLIGLEYSAFVVNGRPDLGMVVYIPSTPADADRIRSLLEPQKPAVNKRRAMCKAPATQRKLWALQPSTVRKVGASVLGHVWTAPWQELF